MNYKFKCYITLGACIIMLCGLIAPAFAAINLSISSSDGGGSLSFGRVDMPSLIDKEVRLRISSSDGIQYQVFQRLNFPLQNEKGQILDRNVILSSALIDSNTSGTLYAQEEQQVSSTDQLLYTSSQDGTGDSFTLVYQVDEELLDAQGSFSGEIIFTVRNISGGGQDDENLTLYLDTSTSFEYETEISTGLNTLSLNSLKNTENGEYFLFKFSSNYGSLKVYQELEAPLIDAENQSMEENLVLFRATGGESGELFYQDLTPLEESRILLYESREQSDEFLVYYYMDPDLVKEQTAGIFSGRLKFIIESDGMEQELEYFFEANVEPYFNLSLEYPEAGMAFKDLLPQSPVQMKEVLVSVDSNIGSSYVVTQKVNAGGLSNADGYQIEKKYFTLSQELVEGAQGKIAHDDFVPVEEGETQVFFSDKRGSASKFKVYYRLQPYLQIQGGDYTAAIVFTLEEI